MPTLLFIFLAVLRLISVANAATQITLSPPNDPGVVAPAQVNLRIEGPDDTIFEGVVTTTPHDISTPSSNGTYHCDGTNYGAYPTPGATATTALDDASKGRFQWDATFFASLDDFFITSIGGVSNTTDADWGFVVNRTVSSVGGCQRQVENYDDVVWAFGLSDKAHLLRLIGAGTGWPHLPIAVVVIDRGSLEPISGARIYVNGTDVAGTNDDGLATFEITQLGVSTVKARRADSLRSNTLSITIENA